MGCIARLGCLIVLAVLAAGAWLTRGLWLPERYRSHAIASTHAVPTWQPVSSAGADRARIALDKLSQPTGQAFQTISAADLASFAFRSLPPAIAASADSVSTKVSGESVSLRASVRTADLRASGALGSYATLLGDREPLRLTGTFRVVHPGLAEFDVQEATVRDIPIPKSMIPAVIKQVSHGRPAGLAENGLPLPIPQSIGDIRVANGKVTLYRSVP